mmetsp:Transcript_18132/g.43408  ORF Transcript_18132/g.43408 Transcript_18132/m.43408 type:complete len:244 (+) Transcript_18132:134-865(+)
MGFVPRYFTPPIRFTTVNRSSSHLQQATWLHILRSRLRMLLQINIPGSPSATTTGGPRPTSRQWGSQVAVSLPSASAASPWPWQDLRVMLTREFHPQSMKVCFRRLSFLAARSQCSLCRLSPRSSRLCSQSSPLYRPQSPLSLRFWRSLDEENDLLALLSSCGESQGVEKAGLRNGSETSRSRRGVLPRGSTPSTRTSCKRSRKRSLMKGGGRGRSRPRCTSTSRRWRRSTRRTCSGRSGGAS